LIRKQACTLLQKEPIDRTHSETAILIKAFENIQYFKNSFNDPIKENYRNFIKNCADNLKFEFFEPGKPIVHYGEHGDKFYIILQGELDIYIMKSHHEMEQEIIDYFSKNVDEELQYTLEFFLERILRNYKEYKPSKKKIKKSLVNLHH
jgi:CRP-like cAMP-binding protein